MWSVNAMNDVIIASAYKTRLLKEASGGETDRDNFL